MMVQWIDEWVGSECSEQSRAWILFGGVAAIRVVVALDNSLCHSDLVSNFAPPNMLPDKA